MGDLRDAEKALEEAQAVLEEIAGAELVQEVEEQEREQQQQLEGEEEPIVAEEEQAEMEIEEAEEEVEEKKKAKKGKTSKYFGVSKIGKRYRAMFGGKYIGMADLEIDAARMVNEACGKNGVAPKNRFLE